LTRSHFLQTLLVEGVDDDMWRTATGAKRLEILCSERVDALGKKKSLLLVARFAGVQFLVLRTAL
jgi:hypothetical protein